MRKFSFYSDGTRDGNILNDERNFLHDRKALNVQNRTVALIENGSWAPASGKQMRALLEEMKGMEILEPTLTVKSVLKETSLEEVKAMAKAIAASLNA